MGKVKTPFEISNIEKWEDGRSVITTFLGDLISNFNGNIDFIGNCRTSLQVVNFTAVNQSFQVPHSLNRLPIGYFIVKSSIASPFVFDGAGVSTTSTISLQCSAVAKLTLLIF